MIDSDKVLSFIRMKGLVLPAHLAAELKQDMIIAGAVLAELSRSGKVRVSHAKVGGSPVYYVPEQRSRLQELYKYLNEKDRRAYDLLKQKQLLRDSELTPLLRVSLRSIRDFAKPVEVTVAGRREIFWRWYLYGEQDASAAIQGMFAPKKQPSQQPPEPAMPEEAQASPEAVPAEKDHGGLPQGRIQDAPPKENDSDARPKMSPPPGQKVPEAQQNLPAGEPAGDTLHEKCKKFFKSTGIGVLGAEVIRRNSEIDYTIEVPSAVGKIKYYCKAKAKKKCGEGDLASAFVKGQIRKLPVLFVTSGELTKKARELALTDFGNMKTREGV